jgi:hypothetical protein
MSALEFTRAPLLLFHELKGEDDLTLPATTPPPPLFAIGKCPSYKQGYENKAKETRNIMA